MTETQMHIPQHIDMTRRIAAQETASVTALTVQEQQLQAEYDRHQAEYDAEQKRIEAELRAAAEQGKAHLDRLAAVGKRMNGQVQDIGIRLERHRKEAEQAQQSVADWCTRQGINPSDLPPLPDTGPLPVVAAEPKPLPTVEQFPDQGVEIVRHPTTPAFDVVRALPAIEEPDGLLAQGAAMANPNGDPNTTQVDGGDGPTRPFQGGVEVAPRPRKAGRRAQGDRVNRDEQDGDA
jgi:hypothetical protein